MLGGGTFGNISCYVKYEGQITGAYMLVDSQQQRNENKEGWGGGGWGWGWGWGWGGGLGITFVGGDVMDMIFFVGSKGKYCSSQ